MEMKLRLSFDCTQRLELLETCCQHPGDARPLRCVRGKTSGAFSGYGTFLWSSAVQAISLLFVRAKIIEATNPRNFPCPLLQGFRGSSASSLDMSISAKTNWLAEMFGHDSLGEPMARRIFTRSNSSLKLPGPVTIGINARRLALDDIEITLGSRSAELRELVSLERHLSGMFAGRESLTMKELECRVS